jgi:hypothetical protein
MAKINKNIEGYEFVKNVKKTAGYERCGYNMLFVVRRNSGDDYLSNLVAVCKNEGDNWETLEAKYPFEEYIVWSGEIITLPAGSYALPEGGDMICFYWS